MTVLLVQYITHTHTNTKYAHTSLSLHSPNDHLFYRMRVPEFTLNVHTETSKMILLLTVFKSIFDGLSLSPWSYRKVVKTTKVPAEAAGRDDHHWFPGILATRTHWNLAVLGSTLSIWRNRTEQ